MDVVSALLIGVPAAFGGAAVALLVVRARLSRRAPIAPEPAAGPPEALVRQTVDALGAGVVVLGPDDGVLLVNPAAQRLGAVRAGRIGHPALRTLGRQARTTGELHEADVEMPRGRGLEPLLVRIRVAPLSVSGHLAVQIEDLTESQRLADVRRDFVANVSHELKTPVGALALLAEAVLDATDDPVAVQRFAERMRHESQRLARLVQELIELSRLQGAEPLPELLPVPLDQVIGEVLDRTRLPAEAREIEIAVGGTGGLVVEGSESQLVTALVNLVENAVAYSPVGSRVAIGVRPRGHLVELSVSDQGMGIADRDLPRIFERFYRADPARSRSTGGTGLGLAIVKHIATNHGGSVDVWSVEGSGSTFTLRLPVPASTRTEQLPAQSIATRSDA